MQILTLNIWGAPYAKHISARVDAIAEEVRRLDPDILCFQEVYLAHNRKALIDQLKDVWRYYHYFPSALLGSGLLTMSKYPIVDAVFHRYRMQGKPDDLKHGDYYAGKGAGLTRIQTDAGAIDVYNSHTHAQYEPDNDNEYAAYTESNLYELARFIDSHSGASPVVLCGDLNTRPDQAGYRIITHLGSLVDSGLLRNQAHLTTFSLKNPYVQSRDQCLDYVFARNIGAGDVRIVMDAELRGGQALAYSDHYGLLAEIDLSGEKLNQYDCEIAPVIRALRQRVDDELIDTESGQIKKAERMLLAFGSLFDGFMIGALIKQYHEGLSKAFRRVNMVFAIVFAFWQIVQIFVNYEARKNTLRGLRDELDKQIESGQLFDGRRF